MKLLDIKKKQFLKLKLNSLNATKERISELEDTPGKLPRIQHHSKTGDKITWERIRDMEAGMSKPDISEWNPRIRDNRENGGQILKKLMAENYSELMRDMNGQIQEEQARFCKETHIYAHSSKTEKCKRWQRDKRRITYRGMALLVRHLSNKWQPEDSGITPANLKFYIQKISLSGKEIQ